MNPLLVFAGTYGPNIASWLLAHSGELGDASARVIRPAMAAMAAITDPTASLDRIGSALVAQQNGQTEVIGRLHQHASKLDGIAAPATGPTTDPRPLIGVTSGGSGGDDPRSAATSG